MQQTPNIDTHSQQDQSHARLILIEVTFRSRDSWRGGREGKTAPSRGASSIFHWAKTEGEKAESGDVVPREGAATPPHLLGGLGSAVRSPSGARGGAPTAKRFPLFSALRSLFWHDNNVNCGLQPPLAARAPVPPPLAYARGSLRAWRC